MLPGVLFLKKNNLLSSLVWVAFLHPTDEQKTADFVCFQLKIFVSLIKILKVRIK